MEGRWILAPRVSNKDLTFPGSLCEGENTIFCGEDSSTQTHGSCT